MARIKIQLPPAFGFSTAISVRITDVNFGGHVGNDALLGIIHEARTRYLHHYGYDELHFEGVGLIMSDVGIEFKKELFYGQRVKVSVVASEFTRIGFDLFYLLELDGGSAIIAHAKTGMVCYDYNSKKVAGVPEKARSVLALPIV